MGCFYAVESAAAIATRSQFWFVFFFVSVCVGAMTSHYVTRLARWRESGMLVSKYVKSTMKYTLSLSANTHTHQHCITVIS